MRPKHFKVESSYVRNFQEIKVQGMISSNEMSSNVIMLDLNSH